MQKELTTKINNLQSRIENVSNNLLGKPDITIIAVSKKKTAEHIKSAYEIGIRDFGENYAQEFEEKVKKINLEKLIWHFIGPIQSNKTRSIATYAHWIHSLNREKIVTKINKHCADLNKKINGCIQVNISEEESKSGIKSEELLDFADYINSMENIDLKGIMVLPSLDGDVKEEMIKSKKLHKKLMEFHPNAKFLSMGTTNDFESAIKFGSNMIRIGELIFGER